MKSNARRADNKGNRITLVRAEHLLAIGDAHGAATFATRVLKRDHEQIGALEVLAKALWQLARFDELLGTLSTLIRLNPYEPGYHALKGAVYQSLGRSGEAIRCFARAGEDSPTVAASVQELRAWQEKLIADLIDLDPVFRVGYQQNPQAACMARGFEFALEFQPSESWLTNSATQRSAFSRPS